MPVPIWPAPMTPIFLMTWGSFTSPFGFSADFTATFMTVRPSVPEPCCFVPALLAAFLQFCRELRQRLKKIGNEAIVRDLENRGLAVLVDRYDDLGILHAGEVLDRARDADRHVEVGRHDLAGLAHL